MFETIRNRQRLMQLILLILVFPAFAFFGLPAYERMSQGASIATVGGTPITQEQFEQAQREQMDNLRQRLGDSFDPALLRTPAIQREILDGLVTRQTLAWAAHREKIAVSDDELRQFIAGVPGLTDDKGNFDRERYASLLAARGASEAGFEYEQRRELALQAIPEAIGLSSVLPRPMVENLLRANEEVRVVSARTFLAADEVGRTGTDDAAFRKYYEEHPKEFERPESVKVEYVVLRPEDVAARVHLDPGAERQYYDANPSRFGTPEERRASHILVSAGNGDADAARKRALELKAEIEAGRPFAEVAKEASDDTASRDAGGDLGWFARGDMVAEVADAAFGLKDVGEVAGPVRSEFGWHLVQLDGIREASIRPFEDVREEIGKELREQQARLQFGEAAEEFSNSVYEQADTLAPAAERLGLKVQTAEGVRRTGIDDGDSPLNRPAVLRAIFSPASLEQRQNTETIELGNGGLLAARVLDHQPARVPAYDEVEAEVGARVKALEAARLAREAGEKALDEARKAGAAATGFGEAQKLTRASAAALGPDAIAAIFNVDRSALPAFTGLARGNDYVIFKVTEIDGPPQEKVDERRPVYREQAASLYGQAELAAVIALLREQAGVTMHLDQLPSARDEDEDD